MCYATITWTKIDLCEKLNKFLSICRTVHRYLKNETKKERRIVFNTVREPVLMYSNEAIVMTERDKAKIQDEATT